MIAIDATPLVLAPRRGVARALEHLLGGLAALADRPPVRLFAPAPLPEGLPALEGALVRPAASARAFRGHLGRLLEAEGVRVLLSPWSAFPRTPVPVVATVHEVPFVRDVSLEGRLRARRHHRWLRRNGRCAAVLVPSEATRQDVLATGLVPAARLARVPNAFDPAPWREAGRAAAGAPPGPDLVMVGTGPRNGRKKGLDVLLAALGRPALAGREAVVVGRAPRGDPPPGVRFLEAPDDAALRALVASARVLVHPARSEGFGYPPLEAMAAGVPAVVARAGSLPEVVGDAALLVPPGDAGALAEALLRAFDDDALRSVLVQRGHARARAFPPQATARATLAVLEAVAQGAEAAWDAGAQAGPDPGPAGPAGEAAPDAGGGRPEDGGRRSDRTGLGPDRPDRGGEA